MNVISHPRIQNLSIEKIEKFYKKNEKIKIIYDAPLSDRSWSLF